METKASVIFICSLLLLGFGPLIFFETLCPKAKTQHRIASDLASMSARNADKEKATQRLFSIWNGACKPLEHRVKSTLQHPRSYKHVKTRYRDCGDHLRVTMSFCSKNALGATVKKTVFADVDLAGRISTVVGLTDK